MDVSMTVREIVDKGLWDWVCEVEGINPWARNEGLITEDEVITFTGDNVHKLMGKLQSEVDGE